MKSLVAFLYFRDYEEGKRFITEDLELKVAHDVEYACLWHVGAQGFLGAVKSERGAIDIPSIEESKGVLISITVEDSELWYEKMKAKGLKIAREITYYDDIKLKSFFIEGPEKYQFEIQQFMEEETKKLFFNQL